MSEWPKKAIDVVAASKYGSPSWDPFAQDYVSADLARELYEALSLMASHWGSMQAVDKVLARYEREVGNVGS